MGLIEQTAADCLRRLHGAIGLDQWPEPDSPRLSGVAQGGPSKYVLALDLLSYARNRLKYKPQFVLFGCTLVL